MVSYRVYSRQYSEDPSYWLVAKAVA